MPEAEVTITTQPLALDSETVHQRVMIIAANHGAAVHHITVHRLQGRLSVGFDLEIDGHRSIREAHDVASHLEADIRSEFGGDIEVETHIEPLQSAGAEGADVPASELETITVRLTQLVKATESLRELHNIRARKTAEGLIVIFHCRAAADQSVAAVHNLVDELERQLRQSFPHVWRVIAHAEPLRGD